MSRTVGRSLEIIEYVAASPSAPSLMDVSEALAIDKTTCSRLMGFLVERGWFERDDDTKRFSLGPALIGIASSVLASKDTDFEMMRVIRELRNETDETVSILRRFGHHLFCTLGIESTQLIRRSLAIGEALTLTGGPAGKTVLAFLDSHRAEPEYRDIPDGSRPLIEDQLHHLRCHGFLSVENDRTEGVSALVVPIFDADGIYGSLSVSGPASRWNEDLRAAYVPSILSAAMRLTEIQNGSVKPYGRWASR